MHYKARHPLQEREGQYGNIAKCTTDPRVEFIIARNLMGHITSSKTNLDQISLPLAIHHHLKMDRKQDCLKVLV